MKTPMHFKATRSPTFQRGVGLIEVLVAVLILALGLLGMAGLQANALKTNQSSYGRTQAVMLSYYMLDAMRADRNNAALQNYNTGAIAGGVIEPACSANVFNQPNLLDNTRKDWLESLKFALGNADSTCGAIHCEVTGECTIQITWDDSRAGGSGQQRLETRSRL
ncbi:MAG: type IV pilus modification protein PilV [Hydrogenophaga sp.]|nr:type IV pilus modification protein PilV [Hydrogenophaga sp.]